MDEMFSTACSFEDNTLKFSGEGYVTQIIPWGIDGLRVIITPNGGKKTSDWALDIPLKTEGVFERNADSVTLRNGRISVTLRNIYTQTGHMEFYRHDGTEEKLLFEEYD